VPEQPAGLGLIRSFCTRPGPTNGRRHHSLLILKRAKWPHSTHPQILLQNLKNIDHWSLTSLRQRLVKTGGRLVKHARYYWLLLAGSHPTRRLFGSMVRRIDAPAVASG